MRTIRRAALGSVTLLALSGLGVGMSQARADVADCSAPVNAVVLGIGIDRIGTPPHNVNVCVEGPDTSRDVNAAYYTSPPGDLSHVFVQGDAVACTAPGSCTDTTAAVSFRPGDVGVNEYHPPCNGDPILCLIPTTPIIVWADTGLDVRAPLWSPNVARPIAPCLSIPELKPELDAPSGC